MTEVFLGLGTNLGDREASLHQALRLLVSRGVEVIAVSPIFETDPVGYKDQPRFLNAACKVKTDVDPHALLRLVKGVEEEMGRTPSFRNAPRTIDIDILFYGDQVVASPELELPHPGIAQRAFVLYPLASIAAEFVHPVLKRSVQELLQEVGMSVVQVWGPPPDLAAIQDQRTRVQPGG